MYFSYGFPKSLLTGATAADAEAVYAAASPAGDYVVLVFNATVQVRRQSVCLRVGAWRGFCIVWEQPGWEEQQQQQQQHGSGSR